MLHSRNLLHALVYPRPSQQRPECSCPPCSPHPIEILLPRSSPMSWYRHTCGIFFPQAWLHSVPCLPPSSSLPQPLLFVHIQPCPKSCENQCLSSDYCRQSSWCRP